MEHSHRRLNQTRLNVFHFEDRLQPGSILLGGVDLLSVTDLPILSEPVGLMQSEWPSETRSKRVDVEIVAANQAPVAEVAATAEVMTTSVSRSSAFQGMATHAASAGQSGVNPAIYALKITSEVLTSAPVNARQNRPPIATRGVTTEGLSARPIQEFRSQGTVQAPNVKPLPFNLTVGEPMECHNGSKANVYLTYDGTAGTDENFAVAGGKGPNIGTAYVVGHKGAAGSLTVVDATGATCTNVPVTFSSAVEVTDVAVNNNGVYVVGNSASGNAFIAKFTTAGAFVTGLSFSAGGTTFNLQGVAVSPNGAVTDVFATGYINDGTQDNVLAYRFDKDLTVEKYTGTGIVVAFATPSQGLSVDADRPNNAYHGIRIQNVPGDELAYTMRVDAAG